MPSGALKLACAAGLFLVCLVAFREVTSCRFVNLDDPEYVQNNPVLFDGLGVGGIKRAFSTVHAGYWIPLTWLSYQVDYALYGLAPGGYHRTNLLLHATTAVLLFLLLARLTDRVFSPLLAAALFALHPVQVESVAWVTERKDVLSTLFAVLALGAYARWARRPTLARYLLVVLLLALGLMAKPMLVTLPCVMLLLDFWPLGRWTGSTWQTDPPPAGKRSAFALVIEKLPLFALVLAAGLLTVQTQKHGTAVRSLDEFPVVIRLENAAVSCVAYLRSLIWPNDLAVFYPHPGDTIPASHVAASATFLLVLTLLAILLRRRAPYVLFGWLWFLGTLAPVSGLLQAGWQGRADRFLYVPSIGLFVLVAWGLADLARTLRLRIVFAAVATVAVGLCAYLTMTQVRHWRDSLTLWEHTVRVTPPNFTGYDSLAAALLDRDRAAEAKEYLLRARDLKPDHDLAPYLLGLAHRQLGETREAINCWRELLQWKPDHAEAHAALAEALADSRQLDEAEFLARQATQLAPSSPVGWHSLATIHLAAGRNDDALAAQREAVRLHPHAPPYRLRLIELLDRAGRHDQADAERHVFTRLFGSPPPARP